MAVCNSCGAQLEEGARFCPGCGQTCDPGIVQPAQQTQPEYQQPPQQYQQPPQQQYQQPPQQQYQQPQYQQPPQQQYQQPQYQQPPQQQYQQPQYQQPPQQQYQQPQDDAQANKMNAVFCYLGILFLIPLLQGTHKTSPFTKFHLNQGIIVLISYAAIMVAWAIVAGIASAVIWSVPGLGILLYVLSSAFYIVPIVFCIMGIVNAVNGRMTQLPLIGKFTILK